MKPSERIYEIFKGFCQVSKCTPDSQMASDYDLYLKAMAAYLDEQYEKEEAARKELSEKLENI